MRNHLTGATHLANKQKRSAYRLREEYGASLPEIMVPKPEYFGFDKDYWKRADKETRMKGFEDEEISKQHDTKYFDKIKPKFDQRTYDHGQFKNSTKDLYCEICGVTVATRDVMDNHLKGKEHQRQAKKVERYNCSICNITVPCQNTLDNHMRGKDHIKKERQIMEEQKRLEKQYGSIKLEPGSDEGLRLKELEQENKTLKRRFMEEDYKNKQCIREHGKEDEIRQEILKVEAATERLRLDNEELRLKIRALTEGPIKEEIKKEEEEYTEDRVEFKPKIEVKEEYVEDRVIKVDPDPITID